MSWEQTPLCDSFDFMHYKAVHKHLFENLYDWAGKIRDVNISKKGTHFCPAGEIEDNAERIFSRLRKFNFFKGLQKNAFRTEFIEFYVITNNLHPFREGNGRTQRIFLEQLAQNAGYELNFGTIDVDELMMATILSAQGVTDQLTRLLKSSIKSAKPADDKVIIMPPVQKQSLLEQLEDAKSEATKRNAEHNGFTQTKRNGRTR